MERMALKLVLYKPIVACRPVTTSPKLPSMSAVRLLVAVDGIKVGCDVCTFNTAASTRRQVKHL